MPGDHPCDIASGPTVGDSSTCEDALAIMRRYHIELPDRVRDILESGRGESNKPDDARLARVDTRIIATPQMALEAAAKVARAAGFTPYILGDSLEGEARDVGKVTGPPLTNVNDFRAILITSPGSAVTTTGSYWCVS